MTHQAVIIVLALTSALQIQAAVTKPIKPMFPVRIELSMPGSHFKRGVEIPAIIKSVYFLQEDQPVPFASEITLGGMCQMAHQHNVPWCFLIATIKTITPKGKEFSKTGFFDAATLYKFMKSSGTLNSNLPYLVQFANFLAYKHTDRLKASVSLAAFNLYPNGLTLGVVPGEEDQLGLQLHYTAQLFDNKKPIDLTGFRHLVYSKCVRYMQRTQVGNPDTICPIEQREREKAKEEAQFWLRQYAHKPHARDHFLHDKLLKMNAFGLIQN